MSEIAKSAVKLARRRRCAIAILHDGTMGSNKTVQMAIKCGLMKHSEVAAIVYPK